MKKERNSFFSQYGVSAYNTVPNMMPNNNGYMGANMQANSYMNMATNQFPGTNQPIMYDGDNLEARLSKIERELQRLDTRITKLESGSAGTNISNTDYNFANSMYMV